MLKTTAKHCTGYSKWEYKCLYFIKKKLLNQNCLIHQLYRLHLNLTDKPDIVQHATSHTHKITTIQNKVQLSTKTKAFRT